MKTLVFLILFLLTFSPQIMAQTHDDLYYSPNRKPHHFMPEKSISDYNSNTSSSDNAPFANSDGEIEQNVTAINSSEHHEKGTTPPLARRGISTETYDDGYGNTYITNNYYGDYFDNYPSYTARLNRFYRPFIGVGYYSCFYDPFWCDPFWFDPWWGWSPWFYSPGFSITIGWGWPGWYRGWVWGMPYYGWAWGWGGTYWNGYFHGYWNGFYDGLYSNFWQRGWAFNPNPYGTYYGPRRLAAPAPTDHSQTSVDNNSFAPRVIRSEIPVSDQPRAVEVNRYTRDVTPASSYNSTRNAETYSPARNRTNTSSTHPEATRPADLNRSGRSGIRMSHEKPGTITPPRNSLPAEWHRDEINSLRKSNYPAHPRIRSLDNLNAVPEPQPYKPSRTSPAPNHKNRPAHTPHRENILPAPERNYERVAPPARHHTPSAAPSHRGGALSPAPVSPGNMGSRGGNRLH